LGSPRGALFNLDWVTLLVMFGIALVGLVISWFAKKSMAKVTHQPE
jgi:hypothetical protein